MPTSSRKAGNGGRGHSAPAASDLLRDGAMQSHLWLYHSVWTGDVKTRAGLREAHDAAHEPRERMFPHTHKPPRPREEFSWDA